MKLKNKLLFVIFILLLFLFIFSIKANASFDFSYNDVTYTFPDLPENSDKFDNRYFSIFKYSNGTYQLLSYVGFDPSTMIVINNNTKLHGVCYNDGSYIKDINGGRIVKFWTATDDTWTFDSWQPGRSIYEYYGGAETADKFIYSTVDIYPLVGGDIYGNTAPFTINSGFFFQKTLQLLIPQIQTVEELPKIVTIVIKTIIPIGLIIFGILLLVLLIRWVILRVI